MRKILLIATVLMTVMMTYAQEISNQPIIVFADANVKALCVSNWDTDGDGELSKSEAAAVTDLGKVFKSNTEITSFDELQYFTNLLSINNNAFFCCSGLTSITIPNSVTSIGDFAFSHCSGLTSITIPNNVTSIGYCAFWNCSSLASITIPNSVTSIGDNAFSDCSGLTSITIPNSVTSIGDFAFSNCSGLTSITIPNSVTRIGGNAFSGCSGLTSITIPNNVTSIGYYAFRNCSSLASITIPNSVTSIGNGAFEGTAWFNNQPDGLVYAGKVAYKYKGTMPNNTNLTIKEGTLSITVCAFYRCSGLTSIEIPNSVTNIGGSAFEGCSGLTSVIIPNSVTRIEGSTFSSCSGLTSVTIPSSVTSIGGFAFHNCKGLNRVNISDLSKWCSISFYDNTSNPLSCAGHLYMNGEEITDLVIPDDVTSIGDFAFVECKNIVSVVIPESVTSIGKCAFYYCSGLVSLTVPENISYGEYAFSGCSSLTLPEALKRFIRNIHVDVAGTLPNLISKDEKYQIEELTLTGELNGTDIHFIRDMAGVNLDYMDGEYMPDKDGKTEGILRVLDLSDAVIVEGGRDYYRMQTSSAWDTYDYFQYTQANAISDCMFADCWRLEELILPHSVTTVSNPLTDLYAAIPLSMKIKVLKVAKGNQYYNSNDDCNAIIETKTNTLIAGCNNTQIPNTVTSIGAYAFYGCSGLTSITIPNSVTSIGDRAFSYCSGLTSVIIGNGVTSIDEMTFNNCYNLQEMILSQTAYDNSNIPAIVTKFTTYSKNPMRVEVVSKGTVSATMKIYPIDEQGNTNENNCYTVTTFDQTLGEYIKWKLDDENYGIISEKAEGSLTLVTQPAQPMSTTKARLIAVVNEADDDTHYGFEWLRNNAPDNMPPYKVAAPLYNGQIVGSLSGLDPDVYYKYRPFYQSDSGDKIYGEWIAFNTGDANVFFEPEVHTKEAAVTNDGALLSGVFVEGTEDIQEKGFEYWAVSVSTTRAVGRDVKTVAIEGNNTSVTLEGLKAGTEYQYRTYVKTASGTAYGEEKTFKTPLLGDANNDGEVNAADIVEIINARGGHQSESFNMNNADVDGDGSLTDADINAVVNIIMGK